jgi:hypothetical protein
VIRFAIAVVLSCSHPTPIAADPATAPVKDAGPSPAPSTKYFMETQPGNTDCYRNVWCKTLAEKCPLSDPQGKYDAKWTNKARAENAGAWCCYSSEICEFPAP